MAGKVLETPNNFRIFSSFTKVKTGLILAYFSFDEATMTLKFENAYLISSSTVSKLIQVRTSIRFYF